ncbi:hypothetical protein MMC30_007608 [Trapelia coarctata]|nr:hypothetical protein [Trapelia coarctata]
MSLSVLTTPSLAASGNTLSYQTQSSKTALCNVRVFDGQRLLAPGCVVINDGKIGTNYGGSNYVDGGGAVLLPGFIDAHVHLDGNSSLQQFRQWGVTTALDMGTFPYSTVKAMQGLNGLPDVRGSGAAATVNGTFLSHVPGFPTDSFVNSPADAAKFVRNRVSQGSDYIKLIVDPLGPDLPTIQAIVAAAHNYGKKVISHAPSYSDISIAEAGGVDIITHVPLDKALDAVSIANIVAAGRVAVPTLTMMQSIANAEHLPSAAYSHSNDSVAAMYRSGIPIMTGTDANDAPMIAHPAFGESLHDEMELMVAAGMSNVDVLNAATANPARYFGLSDRGSIKAGQRADLVLISGNPLQDIRATRQIVKVWCAGVQFTVSPS